MPNFLDHLNPDNAKKNVKLAQELKEKARQKNTNNRTTSQTENNDPLQDYYANRDARSNGSNNRQDSNASAEQSRQEALREQERLRQQQARNEASSSESSNTTRPENHNTQQSTYDSSTDELNLSEEDQNIIDNINDLIEKSSNSNQGFVLPDKLPETGGGGELNILDYVKFTKDSYIDNSANSLPDNYSIIREINGSKGFTAVAYKNDLTGDIVVAYSGSNLNYDLKTDTARDWLGNFAAIDGDTHPQVDQAVDFYNEIREEFGSDYGYSVTGHSLGGHLAEYVASENSDIHAVSFDPLFLSRTANASDSINISRVLPPGPSVYNLSEWMYGKYQQGTGFQIDTALLYYKLRPSFKSYVQDAMHNHGLETIIKGIFHKTVVMDTLNEKADELYERTYSLFQ